MEDIVEPTLELYVQEAARLFTELSEAVVADDLPTIRAVAHSLRGSAGNIRAGGFAKTLQTIESSAEDGDLHAVAEMIDRAREEHESVLAYLAEILI